MIAGGGGRIRLRKGRLAPIYNATPRRRLSPKRAMDMYTDSMTNLLVFGLATVFGFSILSANPAFIALSVLLLAIGYPLQTRQKRLEYEFTM